MLCAFEIISKKLFLRRTKNKKAMNLKYPKLVQLAERLVIISGLSAILFTGLVIIGREIEILSNLLKF